VGSKSEDQKVGGKGRKKGDHLFTGGDLFVRRARANGKKNVTLIGAVPKKAGTGKNLGIYSGGHQGGKRPGKV